jgi:hypothetical protein
VYNAADGQVPDMKALASAQGAESRTPMPVGQIQTRREDVAQVSDDHSVILCGAFVR